MPLKALEFFSGIGGLHCALKEVKPDSTVLSSFDINPNAYKVYSSVLRGLLSIVITTISPMCRTFKRISQASRTIYNLFITVGRPISSVSRPMCGFSVPLASRILVRE